MRHRIGWLSFALMLFAVHAYAQVTVSIPTDLTAPPQTNSVQLPIEITDVTNQGIISADLTLTYDTELLDVVGVSLQGTLAQAGMSSYRIDDAMGEVSIAIIASTPLGGAGVLAYVIGDVTAQTTGGTSDLVLAKAHLNSGLVPTQTTDGRLTITDTPIEASHIISVSLPDNLSFPPGVTRLAIPISVSDLTGLGVVSASMRLSYDSSVLVGLGASLVGTIAEGGLVSARADDTAGSMQLSLVFSSPGQPALTGSGTLAYAQFAVRTDALNATTPLAMTHALFNDDAYATLIRDGRVTVNGGDRIQQRIIQANRAYELDLFDLIVGIPDNMLSSDGQLEVSIPYSTPKLLGGLSQLGQVYQVRFVGHEDTVFDQPFHLTFRYRDVDIPTHIGEGSLRVYRAQDGLWQYVGGIQDRTEDTIDVELDRSSTYALLGGYGYGDVTGNGEISPLDASLVLQKVVYLIGDLPPLDRPAFFFETADVSGNREVSAFDAGMILRKSIRLPPHPNHLEEMRFPVETTLPGAAPGVTSGLTDALSVNVSRSGEWMSLTLSLAEAVRGLPADIISLELAWDYSPDSVQHLSVHPNIRNPSAMVQSHMQPDALYVGLVSATGLTPGEPLLTLHWQQTDVSAQPHDLRVRLNDVDVPIQISDFGFRISQISNLKSQTSKPPTQLHANYPNPCNPETWIPFTLESAAQVAVRIFDNQGHLVRELQLGTKPPGEYLTQDKAVHWDGRNRTGEPVASGIYIYQFKAGDVTATRRLVVVR